MTNFKTSFKRFIASLLIVSTASLGLPGLAQASIVTTDEAQGTQAASVQRSKVNDFFARADVQSALVERGVSPDAAVERVRAMTDSEVAQLSQRIDQAPAGGEVLGILFTVFLVLLITDILGWTKVFPFTRSIR